MDYADQNGARKMRFEMSLKDIEACLANIDTITEALTDEVDWVQPFLIPVLTPEEVNLEALKDELTGFWLDNFSWGSINIPKRAERYNCRQSEVREVMKAIAAEHPAPDWEGLKVAMIGKELSTPPYDVFKLAREFHITDTTGIIAFHKEVLAEMEAKLAEGEAEQDAPVETEASGTPNWKRIGDLVGALNTELELVGPISLIDKMVDDSEYLLDRYFPGDRESQLAVLGKIMLRYMQEMDTAGNQQPTVRRYENPN